MSGKYKYMFKFGHGAGSLELLGPSISHFWNDIYDMLDIRREMIVEKLGGGTFSPSEIKHLFGELSEDMGEDYAEIWLEIQKKGQRLRFLEVNILPGIDLDEQEELFRKYSLLEEKPQTILSTNQNRILHFVKDGIIVLFAYPEDTEKTLSVKTIKLLLDYAQKTLANKKILITWVEIDEKVRSFAKSSDIELLDTAKMLQEINKRNLDTAISDFQTIIKGELEEGFTQERFIIYFDLVKSASSNIGKKDTLEELSRYFLNGIEGLKVTNKDYRGPSEEFDLIVANESEVAPLKTIGNPIAVECRHRKTPASSKDIRDFSGKLNAACLKCGILISLKGITGSYFDAVGAVRDAKKSGICIIVIDFEDLRKIAEGKSPIEIVRDCFYKYV